MAQTGKKTRQAVAERALFRCEYCHSQDRYSPGPFSVEQILAIGRSGSSEPENLAFSCPGCNGHKYTPFEGIDPLTGQKTTLFHPSKQVWADHFQWTADLSQMEGISPTGRATIARLRLNREQLLNMRQVQARLGKHPPK